MAYTAPPNLKQKPTVSAPGGNFTELNIRETTGGAPLIRLDDGFVKLLEEQLLADLASGAASDGFLTGMKEAGALRLTGSQPFASAGLKSLQSVVNERSKTAPAGMIGLYRLRREPNRALTHDDLAMFRECCPQGTRLFLLAAPDEARMLTAVIYLGEDGVLQSGRRTVEWPVNLRALGAEDAASASSPEEPAPRKRAGLVKWAAGSAALACAVIAFWSLRPPVQSRPAAAAPDPAPVTSAASPKPVSTFQSALPAAASAGTAAGSSVTVPAPAGTNAPAGVFTPPVRSAAAPAIELQHAPDAVPSAPAGKVPEIGVAIPPPPLNQAAPPAEARSAALQGAQSPEASIASGPVAPSKKAPANNTSANNTAQAPALTPPRPLVQVTPAVSPAIMRGIQGFTIVSVRVDVNGAGKVTGAETVSKGAGVHNLLASAVVDAVRRWQFEPARDNGRPVAGSTVLHFKYINQ